MKAYPLDFQSRIIMIMINILNKMLLKNEFEICESLNYIEDNLKNNDDENFSIEKINNYQFKFFSKTSFGVGTINNFFFTPINVNTEFIKIAENKTKVTIYTKLRLDLIVITVFGLAGMLFFVYLQIFGNEGIPFWVNALFFPGIPLWFWFIYREQEKELFSKVQNFIKSL